MSCNDNGCVVGLDFTGAVYYKHDQVYYSAPPVLYMDYFLTIPSYRDGVCESSPSGSCVVSEMDDYKPQFRLDYAIGVWTGIFKAPYNAERVNVSMTDFSSSQPTIVNRYLTLTGATSINGSVFIDRTFDYCGGWNIVMLQYSLETGIYVLDHGAIYHYYGTTSC